MNDRLMQAQRVLRQTEQGWQKNIAVKSQGFSFGVEAINKEICGEINNAAAVHEIYGQIGQDGASLYAMMLAHVTDVQKERNIFFITSILPGERGKLYPLSLPQDIQDRLIFITPKNERDLMWSFEECLSSSQTGAVIAEVPYLDLMTSRRLQLACEKGNTLGIALCQNSLGMRQSTSARTRWRIGGMGQNFWNMELIGGRGVRPGRWIVKYDETTFSLSLVSSSIDTALHSGKQIA